MTRVSGILWFFLLGVLLIVSVCNAAETNPDCKCWDDFEAEKEGDNWLCRGKKHHRIFGCNEEKPPLCVCKEKGKSITLDLGEVNCVGDVSHKTYDHRDCEASDEWDTYFNKHPHRRLFD